jgi:hypothetical protein
MINDPNEKDYETGDEDLTLEEDEPTDKPDGETIEDKL